MPIVQYVGMPPADAHELEAGETEVEVPVDQRRGLPTRKLLGLACAGAAALAWASLRAGGGGAAPHRADVGATQEKTLAAAVGDIGDAVGAAKEVLDAVTEAAPELHKGANALSETPNKVREHLESMDWKDPASWVDLNKMANMSKHELLKGGPADRHDGNVCPDDEEEHMGLCYKKCGELTDGVYPIRSSAWSCCHEEPCSFFNSKMVGEPFPCHGFDVAGKVEGAGCPHSIGDCMPDEEFSLGICYKKCAILTENKFTYRSGADTCCRYNNHLACMDPANVQSSITYNVGGGVGDGHKSTPSEPHKPMPELTESRRLEAAEQ